MLRALFFLVITNRVQEIKCNKLVKSNRTAVFEYTYIQCAKMLFC